MLFVIFYYFLASSCPYRFYCSCPLRGSWLFPFLLFILFYFLFYFIFIYLPFSFYLRVLFFSLPFGFLIFPVRHSHTSSSTSTTTKPSPFQAIELVVHTFNFPLGQNFKSLLRFLVSKVVLNLFRSSCCSPVCHNQTRFSPISIPKKFVGGSTARISPPTNLCPQRDPGTFFPFRRFHKTEADLLDTFPFGHTSEARSPKSLTELIYNPSFPLPSIP
jgi:hypothetical protein